MKDLKFPEATCAMKTKNITTHLDVSGVLTFEIIPLLIDVRGQEPFRSCERLLNYYERNKSKQPMDRWFING